MKIKLTTIYVDDQDKVCAFYTDDVNTDYERIAARGAVVPSRGADR